MAAKRAIMRIQMDAQAKTRMEKLCEKRGMTQVAMTSRVMNWFLDQDETVQAMVLGSLSEESMAPLARTLLERLAQHDSRK
jgi:hypothetical protein